MSNPDDRPVVWRTDESADDYWMRPRQSREVDRATGRVKEKVTAKVVPFATPYNVQRRPTFHHSQAHLMPVSANKPPNGSCPPVSRPSSPINMPLMNTRDVIRMAMGTEVAMMERRHRQEIDNLQRQLDAALRINHVLTAEMVRNAKRV